MALLVEALTAGLAGHGRADPREGWGATVHLTLHDLQAFGGKADFLRQMDHIAQRNAAAMRRPMRPGRCACPANAACSGAPSSWPTACGCTPRSRPRWRMPSGATA